MIDQFIQEYIIPLSDEDKLDLMTDIIPDESSKFDHIHDFINKLNDKELEELEEKIYKTLLNIPDQVKLDYIKKNPDFSNEIIPIIKDPDIKMSFFDPSDIISARHGFITDAIKYIEDEEKKYFYILKYKDVIGVGRSIEIFKTFTDDKYVIDFLENHRDIVSQYSLVGSTSVAELMNLVKDDNKKKYLLMLYVSKISDKQFYYVLSNLKDKTGIDYIIEFARNCNQFTTKQFTMETDLIINKCIGLIEDPETRLKLFKESIYLYNIDVSERLAELSKGNPEYYNMVMKKLMTFGDDDIKKIFDYYFSNMDKLNSLENFNSSVDIIFKIINSNSSELAHVSDQVISLILSLPKEKWDETLKQMEEVFLKNNIPYVGKIFKVFEIMHPDDYVHGTKSPNINELHDKEDSVSKSVGMRALIFSDLLKCAIGSNNKSLIDYINNIELGNNILIDLVKGNITINDLNDEQREIFTVYIMHLNTLYNNTKEGKENPRTLKENLVKDAYELLSRFLVNEKKNFRVYDLPNRIVKMFCHFAGIDTIEQLKEIMAKEISEADARNRRRAEENNFTLKKGDYYKGLVNENYDEIGKFYTFFINILQNGSISKEFLGSDARSDTTPLDTDLSRIQTDIESFSEPFSDDNYAAARYGPLWLVLKDDERMNYSEESKKQIPGKFEVFLTAMDGGKSHYGIRTGFPSSQIDYFVVDESRINLNRIYYSIVMNGFYIPVLNTDGKLIFTPGMFDEMQKDLNGLSHYGRGTQYEFAPELDTFDAKDEAYPIDVS